MPPKRATTRTRATPGTGTPAPDGAAPDGRQNASETEDRDSLEGTQEDGDEQATEEEAVQLSREELQRELDELESRAELARMQQRLRYLREGGIGTLEQQTAGQGVSSQRESREDQTKRPASQELKPIFKYFKPTPPAPYHGTSLSDCKRFLRECATYFATVGRTLDTDASEPILVAANWLKDTALTTYDLYKNANRVKTWDDFASVCQRCVTTPHAQIFEATRRYFTAKQRQGQTAHQFFLEFEEIERDVRRLELSEEQLQAYRFLHSLPQATREQLMANKYEAWENIDHISAAAQYFEARRNPPTPQSFTTKAKSPTTAHATRVGKNRGQGRGGTPPKTTPMATTDALPKISSAPRADGTSTSVTITCWNCGKKGHRAKECRSLKKKEGEKPKN